MMKDCVLCNAGTTLFDRRFIEIGTRAPLIICKDCDEAFEQLGLPDLIKKLREILEIE